jgi:hypothetical protein
MRTEDLAKKLSKMKQDIEDQRAEKNRAEGQLTALMKQLKDEFGFESVEAAEEKLEEMQKEIEEADEKMEKDVDAFEKKYGMGR